MKMISKLIVLCVFCLLFLFGERILTRIKPTWTNSTHMASITNHTLRQDVIKYFPIKQVLTEFTKFYQYLPTIKKKNDSLWLVTLPQGLSDVEYLLKMKELCKKYNLKISSSHIRSKYKHNYFLSISINSIKKENTYHQRIHFRMGKSYLKGFFKIALLFYNIDNLTKDDFIILNNQPYQKNFVFNTQKYSDLFYRYVLNTNENEVYLLLNMESSKYPYVKPGYGSIYIHNTQKEIQHTLNEKLNLFPKAKGFVTWHGDRSIEHRPLLINLFSQLKQKKLFFIDMINSRNNLSKQVSQELNYKILQTSKIQNSEIKQKSFKTIMDQKVNNCLKKGYEIIALPYSKPLIDSITQYINQRDWKFKKINLVHISKLEL